MKGGRVGTSSWMVPTPQDTARHCIQLLYCISIKYTRKKSSIESCVLYAKNTDTTDPAVRIEHHHLICNAMVDHSEYMTRKDKGAIKISIGSIFSEGVENDGHKMVRFSDESTNN